MSQTDLNVANASGAAVRTDINAHLDALASQSSGATTPTTTFPNQWWLDTSTNILKQRDNANTAWVNTASKAGSNWIPYRNGVLLEAPSQAEAEAGTATDERVFTAERVAQAIAAQALVTGKHTVWIPASAMQSTITVGATPGQIELATNDVMLNTFDFDAATEEHVQFSIHMPKSWDEGTITAQFVWSAASGSGDVVWGLEANAVGNDDALDAAFGTAQTATDTLLTANDEHHSPVTSTITIGGTPAENDRVIFQVFRKAADGGDTLAVDAKLIGISIFYSLNAGNDA